MSFVYPQFLFGLLALGIPIIIHLFNFRRAKRIYFSNNLFLQQVKKASSTKLKIKHYLILLSRLLFILFLVFTFAQPFIPAEEKGSSGNQALIYLDNSYSMSGYVEDDLTGLEAGITYVQTLLDLYPQNANIQLLTNDFAPFSNTAKSKNEILELITEINHSGISRSVRDVKQRISSIRSANSAIDIYWISDFQKSTTGSLNSFLEDTTDNIFLLPVFFGNTANVYVDTVFLSNPFLIEGEKNELNIRLRNDGNQEINDLLMRLYLNEVQSANGSLDIGPDDTGLISFDLSYQLEKYNEGQISFEEFPVTFDNDFYFTLTLADRISIVELKEQDSVTVIEKVFGNPNLFNFKSYNVRNIDYNDMRNANMIIINGVTTLNNSVVTVLSQFIEDQGDVLIIPSSDIGTISYESLTGPLQIFPDSLVSSTGLSGLDLNNPFFSDIFENNSENFDMPEAVPLVDMEIINENLISFRDGRPFLSYQEINNRLYLLSSPLNTAYTDFQTHAIFVPVMYRMAMLSKKEFNKLYYNLNTPVISLNIDSIAEESLIRLTGEETEIIPGQRIAGNEIFMEIPRFEIEPGIYQLEIGEIPQGSIAFNQDKTESKLEQYELEDLQRVSSQNSSMTLFNTKGINNFDKEIKAKYMGIPLWKYALVLSLLFLLAEILIIRFL